MCDQCLKASNVNSILEGKTPHKRGSLGQMMRLDVPNYAMSVWQFLRRSLYMHQIVDWCMYICHYFLLLIEGWRDEQFIYVWVVRHSSKLFCNNYVTKYD